MHVTRFSEAKPYETQSHHGMLALQLQGGQESQTTHLTCGLSHFLPGGGAANSASAVERCYIVIRGSITVMFEEGEVTLGPLDSCYIAPGESRSVQNRTNETTTMLVISAK